MCPTLEAEATDGALSSSPGTRQEHDLLSTALERVLITYAIADAAQEAADDPFPEDGSRDADLRTLWTQLKPDAPLPDMTGKHWQQVSSPVLTLAQRSVR